jgi:diguanylate cyclase (GGDEF)-like protein/PAS domain S-box-containing protein
MKNQYLKHVRPNALPLLVLLFCSCLTSATVLQQRSRCALLLTHSSDDVLRLQRALQKGIDLSIRLNRATAAQLTAYRNASPDRFNEFMREADVVAEHPGLRYIGYVARTSPAAQPGLDSRDENKNASVHEAGMGPDGSCCFPQLFAFPQDVRSVRAKGTDFSAEPDRWAAMRLARDSGKPATAMLRSGVYLERAPSFIVFTPVYSSTTPASTVAERRRALRGFVFSILSVDPIIRHAMESESPGRFGLVIYDGAQFPENILYRNDQGMSEARMDVEVARAYQGRVIVASRVWQVRFMPVSVYQNHYQQWYGLWIFIGGLTISTVLAWIISSQIKRLRARSSQRMHETRFDTVFENYPAAVYSLDVRRRFTNANAKAVSEFKIDKAELIGKFAGQLVVPEIQWLAQERFEETLAGHSVTYDSAFIDGAGTRVDVNVVMIPILVENKVASVLGIAHNITERKAGELLLKESQEMLRLVINHIPYRVFWKNPHGIYIGCNEAFSRDAGLSQPEEIIGKRDADLAWRTNAPVNQDEQKTTVLATEKINCEERHAAEDGSERWLSTSTIPLTDADGQTVATLGLYADITGRKKLERQLREMAHYDSLTGLVNRAFFYHHLEHAGFRARRDRTTCALLYLDLDQFKAINDTYGHDVGDGVLRGFADRISGNVREVDIAARLGGDEFALLLENLADRGDAERVAAKLVSTMHHPFQIGDVALRLGTSIGIAFYDGNACVDDWIRRADQSMYKAKRAGRNRFEVDCV